MSTALLAQLIDAKLEILGELHRLSSRQLDAVVADDNEPLLKVLSAKQQVLAVLDRLDQQLVPFRAEDPDRRQWTSETARERCRQQVQRCEARLKEILLLEKQAELAMIRRKTEIQQQLEQFEQAATAQQAYIQVPLAAGVTSFNITTEG